MSTHKTNILQAVADDHQEVIALTLEVNGNALLTLNRYSRCIPTTTNT